MKIQFVGNRKTGQVRYRGSTSLQPNLVCHIDQPQTCTLEVGRHLSENEAQRLLSDHSDIFITERHYQIRLAVKKAKPKVKKKAAAKKSSKPRASKKGGKSSGGK